MAVNETSLVKNLMRPIESLKPTHMTKERLARAMIQEFNRTPKLRQCTQQSLAMCFLQGTQLGLEFGVHCHAIPFGSDATLITNYQGLTELAYRSDKVESINAGVIYKHDDFDYMQGTENYLRHKIPLDRDRGELIGAWATGKIKGSNTPVITVLTKADILSVKSRSKAAAKSDSPWNTKDEWKMWRKTAIKDLCKLLPKSSELQRALELDDQADYKGKQEYDEVLIKEAEIVDRGDKEVANISMEDLSPGDAEEHTSVEAPVNGGSDNEEVQNRIKWIQDAKSVNSSVVKKAIENAGKKRISEVCADPDVFDVVRDYINRNLEG